MPEITVDIDTISRNRIVSETDKNFFVEAGAGSGKTTMLVNRMVAMVEQGKEIDKICAITFTKAAAGEFYDRFHKMLIDRSNPEYVWEDNHQAGQLPRPTDETRERCERALTNINLCFMGTIDSFCQMILSEHPSEAMIPSDATLLTDMDAADLYKREFVKICAGEYGNELSEYANAFRKVHTRPEEIFVKGMIKLMDNRNAEFHYPNTEIFDIDQEFMQDRQNILHVIGTILDNKSIVYDRNQVSRNAFSKLQDSYNILRRRWSNNFGIVVKALKDISGIQIFPYAMNTFPQSFSMHFKPYNQYASSYSLRFFSDDGFFSKIEAFQYNVSMSFLVRCIPVMEEAMRTRGTFLYFDYLYYLRNMLAADARSNGELIKYIYDRHSYFLIDEFQDTNPMQSEVFFYLTAETPKEKWSECIPKNGSLFIVGDPKQSIYRFRSADVTSFLNVKRLFKDAGGDILYLSRNFRSTAKLCDYFNRAFSRLLSEETVNQSKFNEIPIVEDQRNEFQGTYSFKSYTGKSAYSHPEMTNAAQVGNVICSLVNNPNYLITTPSDTEPRRIRFSDIMVISYGKRKLPEIMSHLDELGIPMKVEGKVPFENNKALKEVFRIYKAVAESDDRIALYGALTGIILGLTKHDIATYRLNGGKVSFDIPEDLQNVENESVIAVTKAINDLKELSIKSGKISPAALLAQILDSSKIFTKVTPENLEVLYYTLELLRNAEKAGTVISLKDGADYIERLLNGGSDEERCLSLSEDKDCVHMANLHKVKGLEAPIVILSAAANMKLTPNCRFVHRDDGTDGYIFSIMNDDAEIPYAYFSTNEFRSQMNDEQEAIDAEGDRLIYVAATRARNALIMCDSVYMIKDKEVYNSKWRPIFEDDTEDFFAVVEKKTSIELPQTERRLVSELYDEAKEECILLNREGEISSYQKKTPSMERIPSKVSDENNSEKDGENEIIHTQLHNDPRLLGTLVHKLLEMMVLSRDLTNVSEMIEEICREYLLPDKVELKDELRRVLTAIADKMKSGGYDQDNDGPKDLLSEIYSSDEVYCEVPFCYKDEAENETVICSGIIDLIYCKEGKWHIIDYKTNLDDTDLDEKYQGQLDEYKKAVLKMTGEEADAYIYHLDI